MKRLPTLCWFIISFAGIVMWASRVIAAFSFSVDSVDPKEITSKEQEVKVVLSITGLPSESYFRAAFQKEGSDTYLGYLKNDRNEWVIISSLSDQDACTGYFRISDIAASSAAFFIKLGDGAEAETGTYVVKAHRFTATCRSYNVSENTQKSVQVVLPSPTHSPTPMNTPTVTHTPSPNPTAAYTPTNTVMPARQSAPITPTAQSTVIVEAFTASMTDSGSVGGTLGTQSGNMNAMRATESAVSVKPIIISLAFVSLGLAILSGVYIWRIRMVSPKDSAAP